VAGAQEQAKQAQQQALQAQQAMKLEAWQQNTLRLGEKICIRAKPPHFIGPVQIVNKKSWVNLKVRKDCTCNDFWIFTLDICKRKL